MNGGGVKGGGEFREVVTVEVVVSSDGGGAGKGDG